MIMQPKLASVLAAGNKPNADRRTATQAKEIGEHQTEI